MDPQASKLDSGNSSEADADPEIGDIDALPTQMGMEISFKVDQLPRPNTRASSRDSLALTSACVFIRCWQHARIRW